MRGKLNNSLALAAILLCVAVCSAFVYFCDSPVAAFAGAPLLLGSAFALADAQLKVTKALPDGAAAITTDGIDLGHGSRGDHLANCELVIDAPALATADLPDTETMTYIVEHDDASDFSGVATLVDNAIVQTGAGGAGAAAASKTVRLPSDVKRYIRVKATNSGAGDASDKSVTAQLKF